MSFRNSSIPGRAARVAVVLVLFLNLWVSVARGGPLFDPFFEEFQVGAYLEPESVPMAGIWPGGLLTPIETDQRWIQAALDLLSHPENHPEALTHRFLACLDDPPFGSASQMAAAVAELGQPSPGPGLVAAGMPGSGFLRTERWRLAVFRAQAGGLAASAARLIAEGLSDPAIQLSDREEFIWELRRRQLEHLAGRPVQVLERPWPDDTGLGPYDTGAVWALWLAHRRAAGLPVLPPDWRGRNEALRLAGLRQADISPAELFGSGFSEEWKAGLGATLFTGTTLAGHLDRFASPPGDFSAQGWWVKGMRFHQRGHAGHYEKLAARPDLHAGWRMDVWRRASELRVLKSNWDVGLANLDQALAIARENGGTASLRRRLRQWVEQAAVLALAQGRDDLAWQLLDRGDATFQGEAGRVFREETAHWRELRGAEPADEEGTVGLAGRVVASGKAPALVAATGDRGREMKQALLAAADRPLWELWFRWGLALADPGPVTGQVRERAIAYGNIMQEGLDSGSDSGQAEVVLAAAAFRLGGRQEILEPLLTRMTDRDAARISGWTTVPMRSPVPSLLPVLRRSQLDMHAVLGLALLLGDMRGCVALAYELPGAGLTAEQKRRFLYPLPAEGPIRQALLEAESEPALILAVARNESLFEPAVRSRAGALGWMQIMPFHFPSRGALPGQSNWASPGVSIRLGDRLLTENRRRYDGDPYLAVAAYNAGPGAAERWRRQLGGTERRDIYLAWIGYPETRNYVEKVLIDREIYDWILADQGAE